MGGYSSDDDEDQFDTMSVTSEDDIPHIAGDRKASMGKMSKKPKKQSAESTNNNNNNNASDAQQQKKKRKKDE